MLLVFDAVIFTYIYWTPPTDLSNTWAVHTETGEHLAIVVSMVTSDGNLIDKLNAFGCGTFVKNFNEYEVFTPVRSTDGVKVNIYEAGIPTLINIVVAVFS